MVKNILIGISLIFGISGFVISLKNSSHEIVYVNTTKLYQEFVLSKELNKELEVAVSARKQIMDSLYENLRQQASDIEHRAKKNSEDVRFISQLEEEYVYKQKKFEKENQDAAVSYDEKIWNRINQYMLDYGKTNHYLLVLGANGQGNIMFGDKNLDVTDDAISYINDRFNDKTK